MRSDHFSFKANRKEIYIETRMKGLVGRREDMTKETLQIYSNILGGRI